MLFIFASDVVVTGRYEALRWACIPLSSALVPCSCPCRLATIFTLSLNTSVVLRGLVSYYLMLELDEVARLRSAWHLLKLFV